MKPRVYSPDQVLALFDAAVIRDGIPALAEQSGMSQTYIRDCHRARKLPEASVLRCLGVDVETRYVAALETKPVAPLVLGFNSTVAS